MHCASLTEHVRIYLSRTACRCDATPVRAVPTRPDVRAGTRPGPVSTGGSVCRVEQSRSSMCAGTQLGRVVQRRQCQPGTAPVHPSMRADTCPRPVVDGRQHR